jgi:hypothetical protein
LKRPLYQDAARIRVAAGIAASPTGIDPFRRRPAGVILKHGLLICLDLLQLESCTLVNELSFARRVCVFTHTWLQCQAAYYKYCASQNKVHRPLPSLWLRYLLHDASLDPVRLLPQIFLVPVKATSHLTTPNA